MGIIKKIIRKIFGGRPEVISFRQGFDLTEIPVVTLYQGETKLNFILDTGSSNSVINSRILDQIEGTDTGQRMEYFGIECVKKIASVYTIPLFYKSQKYVFNFNACDMDATFSYIKKTNGVTIHGMLGSDFFNNFKYVLDFDELIAYSKV